MCRARHRFRRIITARTGSLGFLAARFPVTIKSRTLHAAPNSENIRLKEVKVADTTKITDKAERKKIKRAARKKAAPKAKRTTPRGSQKRKVKKLARGQSKR